MKLKLDYRRPTGGRLDLAVTTDVSATVGDLAAELLLSDPRRPELSARDLTLAVAAPGQGNFQQLDPNRAVGESRVASGWSARIEPFVADRGHAHRALVELTIIKGKNAGRRISLTEGSYLIGRESDCFLVLDDALVSRHHARLDVGPVIEIVDLKSANGIEVDGGRVSRLRITAGQQLDLGDTSLRIEPLSEAGLDPVVVSGGAVPFNRSPRVEPRYSGIQFPSPDIPMEADKPPFPWAMMVVPLLMGAVAYVVSKGNPSSFIFVAMSPLMMLANYLMGRKRSVQHRDSQIGTFEEQFTALKAELTHEVDSERGARLAETPSAAEVQQAVLEASSLMWTRRPEHWSFLHVRLGLGLAPSRNTVAARSGMARGIPRFEQRLDELVEQHRFIAQVPIVESPVESGALGIVGPANLVAGAARSMLVQWAGLHSPAELVVTAMVNPAEVDDYDWLKWLPHTSSPSSPLEGSHLADSPTSAATLLSQIEGLVAARAGSAAGHSSRSSIKGDPAAMAAGGRVGEDQPPSVPVPAIVLLVSSQALVDPARLAQMIEFAIDAGIVVLYVAPAMTDLPAACRTFVDVGKGLSDGAVYFVRHGTVIAPAEIESVSVTDAARFALAMSPYFDQSAVVEDASDLPRTVELLGLLGASAAGTAAAVVDRWWETESLFTDPPRPREKDSGLRARVGSAGATDMELDLRAQGPHAFVGGSTGSGKSEFLQSWILGLAAEYSPQRVTFLFVDYKASSAFEECQKLPHCVGLVTDLSPHLVLRALTSLRAELHTRQQILLRKKANNLIDLERRGDPDCPPALVIVIDEFAALATEVPDFVDGVVDIAQRGRALGIHLIMATQRTAGVIKDSIRANANLRVSLRMTEEADSQDVLGSPVAATFDPKLPGRAMAKTGPGRLIPFQSAFAGGRSETASAKSDVVITELRFGLEQAWKRPPVPRAEADAHRGPTDLVRLVETIGKASALAKVAPPRRPWLPELRRTYNFALLDQRTDTELILGMCDIPQAQVQKPLSFQPDLDGHLLIYGTGGSGKTVVLRTLAVGAAFTTRGGPVQVYCLDFAAGGLRMLEVLPDVGAVIAADDDDRVVRLFRTLKAELERRKREYPANVDSVVAYRGAIGGRADEPRILLLLDGFPAFKDEYEGLSARGAAYGTFLQLLAEGRQFGIHVVLTADRPGSVPSAVTSSIPRRVVLRLAEDTMYRVLDVPKDVLSASSPPGRALVDGVEVQIAVLGGSPIAKVQEEAINKLAGALEDTGRTPTPRIASLPTSFEQRALPIDVAGEPALGIADATLDAIGFSPVGPLLVAGPPGSGRTNALIALTEAVVRWRPETVRYYLAVRRSNLSLRDDWTRTGIGPPEIASLAKELTASLDYIEAGQSPVVVVIEAIGDLAGTEAESSMAELVKVIRRTGHLLIAESETSSWIGNWSATFLNEIKNARRGLLLQPDQQDGESVLRTPLPRIGRNEYPPGRGLYVSRGKAVKVQIPLVDG